MSQCVQYEDKIRDSGMEECEKAYQFQGSLRTTTRKCTNSCTKCQKVVQEGVEYRNTVWHKQCLTCHTCKTVLAGTQFTTIDGQPLCFRCFGQLYAHKCTACTQPIYGLGDGFLVFMEGRRWHIECFRCCCCDTPLLGESSFDSEGGAMCSNCVNGDDDWL